MTEDEVIRIYKEEYIEQHIGVSTLEKKYSGIYDLFRKYGLEMRNDHEKNKKYFCNVDYFNNIDTQEKAYWLGFIMADGYVTSNSSEYRFGISINKNDINHLYKLKETLNATHPINIYEVKQGYKIGTEYCRLIISERKLANDLIKHGCIPHKSNILQPPNISKELYKHWIRGFMDGNGSIIIHNNGTEKTYCIGFTSTDTVLNWIMDVLIEDGIITRKYPLSKRKDEQIVSSFTFGGNRLAKRFCDYIYEDAIVYLQRKYDRYLSLCEYIRKIDEKNIIRNCDICNKQLIKGYHIWYEEGEYKGYTLCRKHYNQLYRNGIILPDKKDYCEVCGDRIGKMTQCGKRYIDYYGVTMCRRHYEQIYIHGKITNPEMGWHNIGK